MKITLTGVPNHGNGVFENRISGYGKVTWHLYEALKKYQYDIEVNNFQASLNICSDNPGWLRPLHNHYNIGFTTHETTEIISEEWLTGLRSMNEIWAMSNWVKECFDKYTDNVSLVIPVCVTDNFKPVKREIKDIFYFLHTGEPTDRKMGQLVLEAFDQEFGDDPNVCLVFKTYGSHSLIGPESYSNVFLLGETLSEEKYISLLSKMNCLVYPTLGEGGGLMPLEALATGMPVITTWEWADYKDFIHLKLDSTLSPIPQHIQNKTHLKGSGYLASIESIREQMRKVYDNYSFYSDLHYNQSKLITDRFNWDTVIKEIVVPRLNQLENEIVL